MNRRLSLQQFAAVAALFSTLAATPAPAATQAEADALFAAGVWPEAAAAYRALLAEDPASGANWFSLAQALQQTEQFAGARDAYERAIDAGYQPVARARYHLARALMSLGQLDATLEQLERLAETGGPGHRTLLNTPEFAPLADHPRFVAVIDALKPCAGPEYRQFDFWLGDWDVAGSGASQKATNHISSAQDGCVVFEQYTAGGFTGMSLNFYDSATQKWHQTWMSNAGNPVYLEGGLNDQGAMQMTDADLPVSEATGVVNRVIWTPNADGSVRQLWESSTDGGATWSIAFDGLYTRMQDPQ